MNIYIYIYIYIYICLVACLKPQCGWCLWGLRGVEGDYDSCRSGIWSPHTSSCATLFASRLEPFVSSQQPPTVLGTHPGNQLGPALHTKEALVAELMA